MTSSTAATSPRIVPFWEKPACDKMGGEAEQKTDNASASHPRDKAQQSAPKPPQDRDRAAQNTAHPVVSPTATWAEAGQYALNSSIFSGRFEDLRILAFSRRVASNRIGAPRALYANSTLVARALPGILKGASPSRP